MTLTPEQRAEAQQWASKMQSLEGELSKLQIKLAAAYSLIDSLQIENQRLRHDFQDTLDDITKMCNDILGNLKR
jgi:peptidoglycan hydrolase CwlO-like protein